MGVVHLSPHIPLPSNLLTFIDGGEHSIYYGLWTMAHGKVEFHFIQYPCDAIRETVCSKQMLLFAYILCNILYTGQTLALLVSFRPA